MIARSAIASHEIPIEQLTITRKIVAAEKKLLSLGQPGETVSYFYVEQKGFNVRTGRVMGSEAVESTSGEYWADWYGDWQTRSRGAQSRFPTISRDYWKAA